MFKEIYFWTYWYLQKIKTNDNPPENALFIVSSFQALNLLTIYGVANNYLNIKDMLKNIPIEYISFGLALIVLLINWILLFSKKEKIFKYYQTFSSDQQKKGKIYFWFYIIFSFILFLFVGA